MTSERRRSPRIELMGHVQGRNVSLDLPVRVIEMSLGGMAVETGVPFSVGTVHVFRLTLGDGSTTELSCRVMHCRSAAAEGGPAQFVTGLQFIDEDPDNPDGPVGGIIGRVR